MHRNTTLDTLYTPLRITYGLVPLLAGLDKFTNLLFSVQEKWGLVQGV